MSVYLYTFRTGHKTALFNGSPIKVYHYAFLCKAQDVDAFSPYGRRNAALLQSQCERAADRFAEHKPAFAVVGEDWNDGAIVYANPKGACWYDCDEALGEPVGFLRQLPGQRASQHCDGWIISNEIHRESSFVVCGLTVRRAYVERIEGGKYTETVKSYTFTNRTVMTPDQFAAWQESEEPVYIQRVKDAQRVQEEQDKARAEAYALQQRRDKVNREIEEARANLARLEQERVQIGA